MTGLPTVPAVVSAIGSSVHNFAVVEVGPTEDEAPDPALQIVHKSSPGSQHTTVWAMSDPNAIRDLADALNAAADWIDAHPAGAS